MKVLLNRLKAAYVSIYLAVASVIAAYAAWQLLQGHDVLTWAGVLLSAAPMALVIGFLMVKPVMARTSADLPEAHVPIAAGVALTAWGSSGDSWLPLSLALISYVGFLLYVYWYSRYGRLKSESLTVGKPLPAFTLTDKQGTVVWTHETDNYRVRPEPETFLEVIRAI
ncbi:MULTISPECIES: hypothetical protein [Thalassolituus]|jgi:membrane protein implicated in regulation of membrane protease activity|uniref:Uncharacterized protein n=1 Tax=Thalassolituus maritimus TaxID=484498 RepID=A0A1N7LZ14_9GAMM|nr:MULTISPECIES: hypothetical protein [Thalassolituus]MAX87614.1 hypothetical protein [Oceanospirillaceae bacterium]MEE3190849.1 hypothetical protein [Pseudomonadota bacterium]TPD53382.1 MAG: hypothetical protein C9355_11680 [Thalassolituus maritimus]SIS79052.1 hypothetical protein SAMN05421686_104313 [Thalassolituus maritimus]|tara:strand:- start:6008 stop:6511 length:504 start_codon:yes stop_codon:yes gene_type:complete